MLRNRLAGGFPYTRVRRKEPRAIRLTRRQAPEDAAIDADGIPHTGVEWYDALLAVIGVHSDSNEDEVSPANDTIILCFLRLPTLPMLSAGRDIVIGGNPDGPECHSIQLIWGFLFTDNNRELGRELRKEDGFVLCVL
ncbi:hypothetical protein POL68_05715 [Stigmatella sp. ncwal1]|uniref:Uncharacterized protein n=1 Tax=Stigmatella ashevillensis TaxID=2995309 RepID=A0ABT5D321_9BACT|nr:hypothetical protein [Stigmatella ashevillena]MDC0707961.1 hypothetical protein [Stigmatella ashevillena]